MEPAGEGRARPGLFRPVPIDRCGRVGPTPNSARGPRWRRSSHGFFVPARVPLTPEQRILEASMVLPEHGGVTGWAALRWGGCLWLDGVGAGGRLRPVWLATAGDDVRSQPGIAISAERLDPRLLMVVDGVRLTVPVRSVDFELRYAEDDWRAVQLLDMVAYSDLVSREEQHAYALAHPGWTGIGRERTAVALAEENSWSPQETWCRLVWVVVAELPRLLCNRPVFDRRGNFIGTPDLLDEEAGVVVEYDGVVHLARQQRGADVRREALFRRHGLEYVAVVAADHDDVPGLAARMHQARERATFQAAADRDWTLALPPWWIPTHTVELRRQLDPARRAKLLGYRIA